MNNLFNNPEWLQPQKPKKLTLQELTEERKRLVEIQRIKKLQLQDKQYELEKQKGYQIERQQKIDALKKIGCGALNVVKAGHQKISMFENNRINAKPIIPNLPKKRKSIYD